jgi:hypothetical protein
MRIPIKKDPFQHLDRWTSQWGWMDRGKWPAKWVHHPGPLETPFVTAYHLKFFLRKTAKPIIHVTADERYELFLDGERIGRGSERGEPGHWYYESYRLSLKPGRHVLAARVWSLGAQAPMAQATVRPGFLLAAEGPFLNVLSTGLAPWKVKKLEGYGFLPSATAWGTGAKLEVDGSRLTWGAEQGRGNDWLDVEVQKDGEGANAAVRNEYAPMHLLTPATLPAPRSGKVKTGKVRFVSDWSDKPDLSDTAIQSKHHLSAEGTAWQELWTGKAALKIPARTRRRVILDLENYVCGYPRLVVSGGQGAQVRIHWAESLFESLEATQGFGWPIKGNRGEVEGKFFKGVGDTFRPDGGRDRVLETLWWEAGRYLEIRVETASQPLEIKSLEIEETGYPLKLESSFRSSDPRLEEVIPPAFRGLQMCSHETYMDCPYYEQLMYVGDSRLEALATYVSTADSRLPKKSVLLFGQSGLQSGLTQSRYPSRVLQVIPPFSLWWVSMVFDHALWRGDYVFLAERLPGVRAVLEYFLSCRNKQGLVEAPNGWNFMDWVPGWKGGMPPDGERGVSGVINWQMAYTLKLASQLEAWAGETELAGRWRRLAGELSAKAQKAFWDPRRKFYSEDLGHRRFAEHSQCLAVLAGALSPAHARALIGRTLASKGLDQTTIYFRHYLFEAMQSVGLAGRIPGQMGLWFDLKRLDLKTTLESPEPARSDCHAWGAHPMYHYFASILGIRPAGFGFDRVVIQPQLGDLAWAKGKLPHPRGFIEVELEQGQGGLKGQIRLPRGISGVFRAGNREWTLKQGATSIRR